MSILRFVIAVLAVAALTDARAAELNVPTEMVSTKSRGTVSVLMDAGSSPARIVFKLAALNRGNANASLSTEGIHAVTKAGHSVALLPAEKLIAEVRQQAKKRGASNVATYSRPQMSRNTSGELDVTGFSGANDAVDGASVARDYKADRSDVELQVEQVRVAVLGSIEIAPGKAAGGQVVLEPVKFSRKEEKSVSLTILFNGEAHEFTLAL